MNDARKLTTISKFLSLTLRHRPELIGLALDQAGWASVDELLARAAANGRAISRPQLDAVIADSDKRRFAFSEDGSRIRANQGHTVAVDLELPVLAPPAELFHGTATRFIDSIRRTGLDRRSRHHVHLTENRETALRVGARYGLPVLLCIDARAMASAGHLFRKSENDVWLVDAVPPAYLRELA